MNTPLTYAVACIEAYETLYLQGDAINRGIYPYVASVGFMGDELVPWITGLPNGTDFNELRIEFGVYVDPANDPTGNDHGLSAAEIAALQHQIGKTTVFLSPFSNLGTRAIKQGIPLKPFNWGDTNP